MIKVSYTRTEFVEANEYVENDLIAFVYDIPYFGACGIFPPFHIINQIFQSGGGDGGMGSGAIWTPFDITQEEYAELTQAIARTPPENLSELARYSYVPFEFDAEFDGIQRWEEWATAVCDKHRVRYHQRIDGTILD